MARLLKAVKEELVRKCLAETFKAREAEHKVKVQAFSNKVYNRLYTEHEQQLMTTIPADWLAWKTNQDVYMEPVEQPSRGGRIYEYVQLYFVNAKTFTAKDYRNTQTIKDDALYQEYKGLDAADTLIKSEKRQLSKTLWAMLTPIHSDSKLITVWPDAVKYMPATDEAGDMAPAIRGSEVNEMIATLMNKRP